MKKYMLSLVALVVAVAAMAFTNVAAPAEMAEEEAVAVRYLFKGESMEEVFEPDSWEELTGADPGCENGSLPCVITVDSGTLQQWLNQRDEAAILEDADSRKP